MELPAVWRRLHSATACLPATSFLPALPVGLAGDVYDRIASSWSRLKDPNEWHLLECESYEGFATLNRRLRGRGSLFGNSNYAPLDRHFHWSPVTGWRRAALLFLQIEPREDWFHFSARRLYLVQADATLSPPTHLPEIGLNIQRRPATLSELAIAVGRTLRYPPGMLRGNIKAAIKVLETIKGKRLMDTRGTWRGLWTSQRRKQQEVLLP